MKYFYELYPEYSYLFLADNKNCPFGQKSGEEIQRITFDALNRFFDNGAKIVIIACNTAAAYSVRKRQTLYPQKKVLSVTVPGVEQLLSKDIKIGSIGVLATQATVVSDIYNDLYFRFGGNKNPNFHFVMAPDLVDLIELGVRDEDIIINIIKEYLSKLPDSVSTLILGCTHFSIYKKYFQKLFKGNIIDPSYHSAKSFGEYLDNHLDIKKKLDKKSDIKFFTTGDSKVFNKIGSIIWDDSIFSKNILI